MAETNASWPGERFPTRLDVEDAHKVPEPIFLRDFKQTLISRDIAREYALDTQFPKSPVAIGGHLNDGVWLELACGGSMWLTQLVKHPPRQSTYPLALLSNFPDIPDPGELGALELSFRALSKNMVFLRAIFMPDTSGELTPPYLRLAMACLASCLASSSKASATDSGRSFAIQSDAGPALCSAGFKVWGLMLEVDNREARKIEAVMAITLLITCRMLSAEPQALQQTSEHMGYIEPIARRLHMHDYCAQSDRLTWRTRSSASIRNCSLLMSHLFLVDVVRAVQYNTSTLFTSSELFITMPASNHDFHDIYTKLLLEEHPLPPNMTEQEDAVLLLSALLSDIITIHNVFSGFNLQSTETPAPHSVMGSEPLPITSPFVPFSPLSEHQRMISQISKGLVLWGERFTATMPEDVLSFFYFCTLCLNFPQALLLPQLSGYKSAVSFNGPAAELDLGTIAVPDTAMRYAWSVVDHVNVERLPDRAACPIWLPIVTYITALVVWVNLKSSSISKSSYGTLKVLGMFKAELQQMPWSCCTEMAKKLDDLMRS